MGDTHAELWGSSGNPDTSACQKLSAGNIGHGPTVPPPLPGGWPVPGAPGAFGTQEHPISAATTRPMIPQRRVIRHTSAQRPMPLKPHDPRPPNRDVDH